MALGDEQARDIAATAIAAMGNFNALIMRLRDSCEPEDYAAFKLAIAKVMGEISVELLWPLFIAHPSLEPKSAEEWRLLGGFPPRQGKDGD